jgi:hypothetical protein
MIGLALLKKLRYVFFGKTQRFPIFSEGNISFSAIL